MTLAGPPANEALDVMDRARAQLLADDWAGLAQIDDAALEQHPQRARLALMRAEAHLQLGQPVQARLQAVRAMAWGCERRLAARVLLAGAHHTLARAALAAGDEGRASGHFDRSLPAALVPNEARRLLQARQDRAAERLRALRSLARPGRDAARIEPAEAPVWLAELVRECVAADDVHDAVDRVVEHQLADAGDGARFFILLSDHFRAAGDTHTALHFLKSAQQRLPKPLEHERAAFARRLVALGKAAEALDLMVPTALEDAASGRLAATDRAAMLQAFGQMKSALQVRSEHGHDLMIAHLRAALPTLAAALCGRTATLIEIGTTREDVPGQGSTRKLAEFCKQHRLHFITVDMDPHNSRMARQTFAALGVPFEAVTMKGEDYLRGDTGPMDFVFLDAYDFDHGKHSELRQSRYQKFLGTRIDELACHAMHLDCAQSVLARLSPFGAVCVDDTWLDQGRWTAKGTLAMPFLLEHGFKVVDARNRAALLVRGQPVAPTS